MLPRFWGASTKRWKDAGSVHSLPMDATEDAPARCVIAFQKPGGHCREAHHLGAPLGAVLGARLLAVGDAAGVERGADDPVAEARQVGRPAAAHEHDGVLLQVVTLAGDVGADLLPVRQA